MSLSKIAERLTGLGCEAQVEEDQIILSLDGDEVVVPVDKEWKPKINGFYRARQFKFDPENRTLLANRSAEFLLVRIDPGYFYKARSDFEDEKGSVVEIAPATKEFFLSHFESALYETTFERIKERIKRRADGRGLSAIPTNRRRRARRLRFPLEQLFYNYHTARYLPSRVAKGDDLAAIGTERVRSCLFSLARSRHEIWELAKDVKAGRIIYSGKSDDQSTLPIPSANYDQSVVSFYKVAKSSQFPSQVFLSYYHILEYHFLRVADETLFGAVRAKLNDPAFRVTYENVTKLVSTIKRNDNTSDEKGMLRNVLLKYIAEEDLIQFVRDMEQSHGEKTYSDTKILIFGEKCTIRLEPGHALSNSAFVLKHIRNALVHSSDRYTREDCYLPFTESENVVGRYIPLVRFLAEKVIFATAES